MKPFNPDPKFFEGVNQFNSGHYFEAHETWEALWHLEKDDQHRLFLQGLIQAAAAFHKFLKMKNAAGAAYLIKAGLEKLSRFPPDHVGVNLGAFRQDLERCLAHQWDQVLINRTRQE